MSEAKSVICIRCPIGCVVNVILKDGQVVKTEGQSCPRGEMYAKEEVVNPVRIFTSSVRVSCGKMLSVKTERAVPKSKIPSCAEALKGFKIEAPVRIGDVVINNIAKTGVNLVATRNVW